MSGCDCLTLGHMIVAGVLGFIWGGFLNEGNP